MICTLLRCVCLSVLGAGLWAQGNFALRAGDVVVFYGDSITDQRLYTTFAETFVITRFPQLRVRFLHSGWGGDRVSGGGGGPIDIRLRRDVIVYRPTVMTIMLGMNDGRYRAFDPAIFQEFASGYESIVSAVKTAFPGIRITVIQPSPYDDVTRKPTFEGGYNAVLVRYSQFLQELARQDHLNVADLNTPVVQMLQKAYGTDPGISEKIIPDRVHPGAGGHLIMAEALLKSWNAPAIVSAVEIDARAGQVKQNENAEIVGVDNTNGLSWTETDRSLPMPVDWGDETLALAVHSSDFLDDLDREELRATGLSAGKYTLKIDGVAIGDFSSDQLAHGINLAEYPTPMIKQAADVHALTLKHNNVHFARWRMVQVPLDGQGFDLAPAESALDLLEDQLVLAQRLVAQPKAHQYQLVREQ